MIPSNGSPLMIPDLRVLQQDRFFMVFVQPFALSDPKKKVPRPTAWAHTSKKIKTWKSCAFYAISGGQKFGSFHGEKKRIELARLSRFQDYPNYPKWGTPNASLPH